MSNKKRDLPTLPPAAKRHLGIKATNMISNTFIYILLTIITIIWLVPFVCIILQSFRVESTYMVGYVIPQQWGLDNYINLFKTDFLRWYGNTFLTAVITSALQTIVVLCMSYTLSRFRFKGRKPLMRFMLVLGMFPGMLTMIILYRVLKDMGMTEVNAVPGLILVYIASSGMGYYVSKGFFDTISKSLDEAAMIDGANKNTIFWRVIMPLSKPIVVYTVLLGFTGPWGDYMFASVMAAGDSKLFNVAVGLKQLMSKEAGTSGFPIFCAAGVIISIPIMTLFFFLQRYYVEGVTGGAVKG